LTKSISHIRACNAAAILLLLDAVGRVIAGSDAGYLAATMADTGYFRACQQQPSVPLPAHRCEALVQAPMPGACG
jgi:hypothetical protein